MNKKIKVSVIGLGFVGAAMSIAIASVKNKKKQSVFNVFGIEQNNKKGIKISNLLNNGIFPIPTNDTKLIKLTNQVNKNKNLICYNDIKFIKNSKIIVIDINLDLKIKNINNPDVDFDNFKKSIKKIIAQIDFKTHIIIQTTVPPGTTNEFIKPIIYNHIKKNNFSNNMISLSYSFERVMPGKHYLDSIINNWRVIGSDSKKASKEANIFFSKFINTKKYPITILDSTQAAEFTKILENSYRAANIAFIEEWSRLAEGIGIDIYKIIDAIKIRHTHSNISKPGLGVGGYCLTKDPLFGKIAARKIYGFRNMSFPISTKSIDINRKMPLETIKLLENKVKNYKTKKIGLFGLSYKEDVGDLRFSPTLTIIKFLKKNHIEFYLHDPFFSNFETKNVSEYPNPALCDILIFCVPHYEYKKINIETFLKKYKPTIIDSFNVLTDYQINKLKKNQIEFLSIGR